FSLRFVLPLLRHRAELSESARLPPDRPWPVPRWHSEPDDEEPEMRLNVAFPLVAALAILPLLARPAVAGRCGACAYPVYQDAEEQCRLPCMGYRINYKTVVEDQTSVCYRPVYRTVMKQYRYTTCRPVYEQHCRDHVYTVAKPVYEDYEVCYKYLTYKPVYEQHVRKHLQTSYRTVHQDYQVPYCWSTYHPVYRQHVRQECYTVYHQRVQPYQVAVPYC